MDYLSDSADVAFSTLSGVPLVKTKPVWDLKTHHVNENYLGSGLCGHVGPSLEDPFDKRDRWSPP